MASGASAVLSRYSFSSHCSLRRKRRPRPRRGFHPLAAWMDGTPYRSDPSAVLIRSRHRRVTFPKISARRHFILDMRETDGRTTRDVMKRYSVCAAVVAMLVVFLWGQPVNAQQLTQPKSLESFVQYMQSHHRAPFDRDNAFIPPRKQRNS